MMLHTQSETPIALRGQRKIHEVSMQSHQLTQTQCDIVRLLAKGSDLTQISTRLGISEITIGIYLNGITKQLEAKTLYQAVHIATKQGII